MKPLADHVRRGSYRRDRHGPLLPANVLAMPSAGAEWVPRAEDFDMMAPVGRVFVEQMLGTYNFTLREGYLLIECGHAAGRLAENRGISRENLTPQEIGMFERRELAWSKQLGSLLKQLKVSADASEKS